jgi:O-acetyl-ADP-ribose deacetylase (regulator of RNase III)
MKTKSNIKYRENSIFESKDQTIVNTVNIAGVMGKGLALEFKKRFPDMYKDYREKFENGELDVGKSLLYKKTHKWILNFPTKKHWRGKSKLEYLEKGLAEFVRMYREWGIESISFPQLGCKNGGLDWSDVQPLMEKYLAEVDIPVTIYLYSRPVLNEFFPEIQEFTKLLPRWKTTKSKSALYYSRGEIKVFWDLGSDNVKIKIPNSMGKWELISTIKLDSKLSNSIEESFIQLQAKEVLQDKNVLLAFKEGIFEDLEKIEKRIREKSEQGNLRDLLRETNPYDFVSAIERLGLENKYREFKKSLVDLAVSKIKSSSLVSKEIKKLTNSEKLLLKILVQNQYKMELNKLIDAFQKHGSTSTLYRSLGTLKEKLLVFELARDENDITIVIPIEYHHSLQVL